ncbi:MAG: pirin family protein [Actinomycetes bacterium]
MSYEVTLDPRLVKLTTRSGVDIRRTLPHRQIRTIGAWCFVDHYGPTSQSEAMSVGAHPHTGLQTVSWLFSGEIEHRDSLGNVQKIHPGTMNLMTAGWGIAHSELSLDHAIELHGVQLWVALPESDRNIPPFFEHHSNLPFFTYESLEIELFIGEYLEQNAQVTIFSDLLGAELNSLRDGITWLPLVPEYEHGFLVDAGAVTINGNPVPVGSLHYLSTGHERVEIKTTGESRLIMLGGRPFQEEILMWWNFIGRTHEEIVEMRAAWQDAKVRFAPFEDRINLRIPAPEMPNLRLSPRAGNRLN